MMFKGSNNAVTYIILIVTAITCALVWNVTHDDVYLASLAILGIYISLSPRIVDEWDRGILLRFGKFIGVLEPGVSWIFPGADVISSVVDMRIRSTSFSAEKALTQDTVPVNVDAVLFWVVTDAKKASLEVQNYLPTITWVAQTTLREVIGRAELIRMISDRKNLDKELLEIIDRKTGEWGITVQSVEIRDVKIPSTLEDAMSRKAQADREKEARIILAESESKVAEEMLNAAKIYSGDNAAFQLRAMNMTYESIKEKGALMVLPSGMADSLNVGALGLATASYRHGDSK